MDAFISGAWRKVARGEVFIGGAWRRIVRAEAYINGAWRSVASFVPPLSLTTTGSVNGYRYSQRPTSAVVTSDPATATPNGGTAPYRYSWQITEGSVTINSPSMATTTFSANLPGNSQREAVALVTCTDSSGAVATGTVQISLSNDSGGL